MSEEKNKKPSVWSTYSTEDKVAMENLCKDYIEFLSNCKTERESIKHAIAEAEKVDDLNDENDLYSEDLGFAEDYNESRFLDESESDELAETDFISKLGLFINQKKAQTKYAALNINGKLTIEQRKVLERVFDLITQEYDASLAESFINTISNKF